jgi:hypothetical protein
MIVRCKSDIKIGDEVESIKKNRTYIVEEIDNNGWIWSQDFGYYEGDISFFGTRIKYKRFLNPDKFRLSKMQIRDNKIKNLLK